MQINKSKLDKMAYKVIIFPFGGDTAVKRAKFSLSVCLSVCLSV